MDLNPEQKRAVTYGNGPLLVLAGAGSGKTRVLTHRFAYLINEKGVEPSRLLAVTFTNKAAGEMRDRVEELTGVAASHIWVSTFHSFCLKILRQHATRIGYRNGFVIFDEGDQTALIRACLKEMGISEDVISSQSAISRISRAKDEYITCDIFEQGASNFWEQRFSPLYTMYQNELTKQNAMDFGDLILNVLELFKKEPGVLKYYQGQFRHILVDEYQDTNHVQYLLIKSLGEANGNIFVVGDEDQSIYRWRGADINNILDFKNDFPGAEIIRLEQNYRSTPSILSAANSIIKNNGGRLGKNLWTEIPDRERVSVVQKMDGLKEARFIASKIESGIRHGYRYDDMAIFYRTNAQSRVFEECFRNSGIPYAIYGGIKFYERMEIKDILAYLKFVFDAANDTALMRIINVPARGIGKSTIEKIRSLARERGLSLNDAIHQAVATDLLAGRSKKNLPEFIKMMGGVRSKLGELTLGDLTKHLLDVSGYRDSYKNSSSMDAEDRLENIDEFVKAVYEFSGSAALSLPEFLDQVALVSDADGMDNEKGAVPMMTVHLSKGLEFPTVFMVGMEEGLFPHSRSMDDDLELEEERRLCYVGMTRAMEKLYMTYSSRRFLHGREQYNLPSRFINEIDSEFMDREMMFENLIMSSSATRHFGQSEESSAVCHPEEAEPTKDPVTTLDPSLTMFAQDDIKAFAHDDPDDFNQLPEEERMFDRHPERPTCHPEEHLSCHPEEHLSCHPEERSDEGSSAHPEGRVQRFQIGARVRHPSFGEGVVQKIEGLKDNQKVIVRFKNNVLKTIAIKYVQLEII